MHGEGCDFQLGGCASQMACTTMHKDSELLIRDQLAAWIGDPGIDIMITTGSTGVTPRDVTLCARRPQSTCRLSRCVHS